MKENLLFLSSIGVTLLLIREVVYLDEKKEKAEKKTLLRLWILTIAEMILLILCMKEFPIEGPLFIVP